MEILKPKDMAFNREDAFGRYFMRMRNITLYALIVSPVCILSKKLYIYRMVLYKGSLKKNMLKSIELKQNFKFGLRLSDS